MHATREADAQFLAGAEDEVLRVMVAVGMRLRAHVELDALDGLSAREHELGPLQAEASSDGVGG